MGILFGSAEPNAWAIPLAVLIVNQFFIFILQLSSKGLHLCMTSDAFTCFAGDFSCTFPSEKLRKFYSPDIRNWNSHKNFSPVTLIEKIFLVKHHSPRAPNIVMMCKNGGGLSRKIYYYSRLIEKTSADIHYTANYLSYQRSSSVIQRQKKKASALSTIVDLLSTLWASPENAQLLEKLFRAEQQLTDFADAFTLQHEVGHYLSFDCKDHPQKTTIRKRSTTVYHDLLLRGRMLRRFFRRVVRDIRRHFRTLVRTTYIYMNSQSEEDKLLGQVFICQQSFLISKLASTWIPKKYWLELS